jgi:hypothetical protein
LDHKVVERKARLQDTTHAADASHELSAEFASIGSKLFPESRQTQHITALHSAIEDKPFRFCHLRLLAKQQTNASEKEPVES